ncbi:von willebrand factor a domain-containing protein 8 [Limosa lapponica baueri]|uniref:von willebrand factor a domain-containing protein 8 n=1 Tax=Limosa lapponica baueri TaxID=1758121 RepID=A0A2I0TND7_LIMLA|nr:von willebrand factor a domain-containing protein 8 [Limosa lapponica baueri]
MIEFWIWRLGREYRKSTKAFQYYANKIGDTVTIGDVSFKLKTPKNPELVPQNYMTDSLAQSVVHHLRWIMQKDLLGQDVFLIGPPGPLRRSIAMQYLCAVRAATEGRILVLEGLEKAERNVLPVLNNLLENREMQLEDGRFLMSAERYDKLLEDTFPMMSVQHVIDRLYPYNIFLGKEGKTAVKDVLKRFELQDSASHLLPRKITKVESVRGNKPFKADVTVQIGEKEVTFQVPAGTGLLKKRPQSDTFIRTSSHDQLLAEMMQSHMVKDMCLIGGKGCGKTVIAKEFADMLGYSIEPIMLYQGTEHILSKFADDSKLGGVANTPEVCAAIQHDLDTWRAGQIRT